ncbi:MAG TPA: hypothetical protein DIW31_02290 [Bacteroidales bacterium]|nr:hypothetical protein [Bacteroidales bacterium]
MTRNKFSKDLSFFLRKHISFQFLAVLVLLISFNSCYNEPNTIGGDMIPGEDKTAIFITDTFKVAAYTIKTDSISTSAYGSAVLGCDNSDIFGKVKSDFMTEFALSSTKDTFQKLPDRPIDSVFLEMNLARTWGQKNHAINVRIYRVNYDIYNSTTKIQYINGLKDITSDKYLPDEVGESFVYSGEDSVRIRLKSTFVDFLKGLPDSAFISHTVLQRYFKGLYITSDDYNGNDGVLYFFGNKSDNIRLVLHHKRQTIRNGVQIEVDTVFNLLSVVSPRFNHYTHDYSSARADLKINHFYDTTTNAVNVEDTVFYVDGLGGVRGMIKLKSAEQWRKLMPIAIHRAQLLFDVQPHSDYSPDSIINPVSYYYKRIQDNDNTMATDDLSKLLDYNISNTNKVSYNKAKKYYSVDVKLHLQNIIKGKVKEDYFFLEPTDFKSNYRQGIFRTGNNSKPIKLIITYSKL